jgi:hypothetical protein
MAPGQNGHIKLKANAWHRLLVIMFSYPLLIEQYLQQFDITIRVYEPYLL